MFRTIIFALVSAVLMHGQPVGFGLKLAVPATDAFRVVQEQSLASSQNFQWGPYLELRLPGGNAVEVDALRRNYDFRAAGTAASWEFPVLLKHRIGDGAVRPFFEGGAAFSRISDIRLATLKRRSNFGMVFGGGVEFKLIGLRLAPELRYTGWGLRNFDNGLQTERNQVAVLMGFGF
jgi:hypothetical protein